MHKIKLRYLAPIPILLLLVGWTAMTIMPAQAKDNNPVIISGTGSLAAITTSVVTFIPAPGSTTANPLFVSCTGTTSTPTTTTAPYLITQAGPATITGVITSNSPGTDDAHAVLNPCGPAGTGTVVSTHAVYTFSSVTISLPNGQSITGGVVLTLEADGTALTSGGIATTTAAVHGVVTGTGDLAKLTGIAERSAVVVNSGGTITVSSAYWAQLELSDSQDNSQR